jgi:hypothetical protein
MSLASQKLKFQLIFSILFVLCALLVTWLIMGESSPFSDYFLWHVDLPNLWAMTTFIPYIFSAIITGNPHSPSMVIFMIALIIQWGLLGFLLSIPISRVFMRRQRMRDRDRTTA